MATAPHTARIAGVAGLFAAASIIAGVIFNRGIPSVYRVARLDEWVDAVVAHPEVTLGSALAYTLGHIAMAGWAWHLGRAIDSSLARAGAALIAVTSLINAAGTTTPIVHAYHVGACGETCNAAGRALLGLTLALDALFSLCLGLGLILCAAGARGGGWTRGLMAVAGVAVLPVAGQVLWEPAVTFFAFSAPLWLALMIRTSAVWLRGDPRRAY